MTLNIDVLSAVLNGDHFKKHDFLILIHHVDIMLVVLFV